MERLVLAWTEGVYFCTVYKHSLDYARLESLCFHIFSVSRVWHSLPWQWVSKTTSPQRKLRCSVQPLRPKWMILFSQTVFSSDCGELVPKTFFSKRISISWSERAVVAFGLFPRPSFFQFFLLCFQCVSQSRKLGISKQPFPIFAPCKITGNAC